MKKIIALILVIGCVLALASCNRNKDDEKEECCSIDTEAVAAVQAKLDASEPCGVLINVTLKNDLGTLNSEYNVLYNEDGTATVAYFYELFNAFDPDNLAAEAKSTHTGTVTVYEDGLLSEEVEGIAFVESVSFNYNLDASKFSYAESVPGTLVFKVPAANTLAVLGVALGADADVAISTGVNGVNTVAISYPTSAGLVEIFASYSYPIPEEEETEGEESEGEETEGEESETEDENAG